MKTLWFVTCSMLLMSNQCGMRQNDDAVIVSGIKVSNFLDPEIAVDGSRLDEWDVAEDGRYANNFVLVG